MRSLLFVPGDASAKMEKALRSGADALVLDLEDAVAPARKDEARAATRAFLNTAPRHGPALWVRINPLETTACLEDLCAVLPGRPAGVLLPKCSGAEEVLRLSDCLLALEVQAGLPRGVTGVLPIVTETPAAVLALASYRQPLPRVAGLTWGAEDLSAAVGAISPRLADGGYTPLYALARALTLTAAAAVGAQAIETIYPGFRDSAGLAAYAARARVEGFRGMFAIHPDQIAPINVAFMPTAEELAQARRIVQLFAADSTVGALSLDGRMLDAPHLKQAQRILALVDTSAYGGVGTSSAAPSGSGAEIKVSPDSGTS